MIDRIDALKTLLTRLIDSREGYRDALEHVTSPAIRDTLTEFMSRRERNAAELRTYLAQAGHSAPDDGSLLASAHRAFTDVKDKLAGSDDVSTLDELVRGEEVLLAAYDEAIAACGSGAGPEYAVIVEQHASLEIAISQLNSRRDLAA